MAKESMKNKLEKIPLEKSVLVIAIVFSVGIILNGMFKIAGIMPDGFTLEVILMPVRMIKEIFPIPLSILIVAIVAAFIVTGIKNSKLWYLLPLGIVIISMYWFVSNLFVFNMLKKAF